ncbi:YlxM family DNA-binding protein [Spiroplasma litorale]|nr:sigma factor-like helix-turn-helix DNA-binding protein [Spiroplasma litorale]
MDFEKNLLISEFYDYYKNLLTEKQRQYFELYFFENYSLQEIAEEIGVSKSAIHDSISKTISYLKDLEEKLKFVNKTKYIKNEIEKFKKEKISKDDFIESIEKEI